jgi:hypothetical protein
MHVVLRQPVVGARPVGGWRRGAKPCVPLSWVIALPPAEARERLKLKGIANTRFDPELYVGTRPAFPEVWQQYTLVTQFQLKNRSTGLNSFSNA